MASVIQRKMAVTKMASIIALFRTKTAYLVFSKIAFADSLKVSGSMSVIKGNWNAKPKRKKAKLP
jgi:hypothetical protein